MNVGDIRIILTLGEMRDFLKNARYIGDTERAVNEKKLNDCISQRQAFKEFGEKNVRQWFEKGLLTRRYGKGERSKINYSRLQLQNTKEAEQLTEVVYR